MTSEIIIRDDSWLTDQSPCLLALVGGDYAILARINYLRDLLELLFADYLPRACLINNLMMCHIWSYLDDLDLIGWRLTQQSLLANDLLRLCLLDTGES